MTYCAVCGKRLNRNKAHAAIEYRRRVWLLCCPLCQATFEKDPERYVAHPRRTGDTPKK